MKERKISTTEAKSLAGIILEDVSNAKNHLLNYKGEETPQKLVMSETDLKTPKRDLQYRGLERTYLKQVARLKIEVLERAEKPDDESLNVARNEIDKASQIYGIERVSNIIQNMRKELKDENIVTADIIPQTSTGKGAEVGLTLKLYNRTEIMSTTLGKLERVYSPFMESKVPESALRFLPRPATIAIIYQNAYPQIDLEKTLELNHKKAKKIEKAIEGMDRTAQFELQQYIKNLNPSTEQST